MILNSFNFLNLSHIKVTIPEIIAEGKKETLSCLDIIIRLLSRNYNHDLLGSIYTIIFRIYSNCIAIAVCKYY